MYVSVRQKECKINVLRRGHLGIEYAQKIPSVGKIQAKSTGSAIRTLQTNCELNEIATNEHTIVLLKAFLKKLNAIASDSLKL
jgi:hypothetical protein